MKYRDLYKEFEKCDMLDEDCLSILIKSFVIPGLIIFELGFCEEINNFFVQISSNIDEKYFKFKTLKGAIKKFNNLVEEYKIQNL